MSEQHLFGKYYQGQGMPLTGLPSRWSVKEGSTASYARTLTCSQFMEFVFGTTTTKTNNNISTGFPSIRFGFLSNHKQSLTRRWFYSTRTRINYFPGSPVSYLLS